jgi:hypothetical protein
LDVATILFLFDQAPAGEQGKVPSARFSVQLAVVFRTTFWRHGRDAMVVEAPAFAGDGARATWHGNVVSPHQRGAAPAAQLNPAGRTGVADESR